MNLERIVSISGKPGLFKVVRHSKRGLVVQQIGVGTHLSVKSSYQLSALDGIVLYTRDREVPLLDVFRKILERYKEGRAPGHKESAGKLREAFGEVLPDFDPDRVYDSHIKKIFQWYNILHAAGFLAGGIENEDEAPVEET